jgi:hypothetical protein
MPVGCDSWWFSADWPLVTGSEQLEQVMTRTNDLPLGASLYHTPTDFPVHAYGQEQQMNLHIIFAILLTIATWLLGCTPVVRQKRLGGFGELLPILVV